MTPTSPDRHDAIPPARLAHFVIRTSRFEEMISWWRTVLVAEVRHQNEFLSFLTYDDEHHRLAIVRMPDLADNDRTVAGLEHVAFTYATIDDLLTTYERLRDEGITPVAPINHGMTLSLYYADPDGNRVELQVDAMNADEAEAFMNSDVFAANPIGVRWDPEDHVARRRNGASASELLAYVPA